MQQMPPALTPTESALWPFALVCTNDAAGAARVLASLVRDHGDLGKLSDSRLRRAVLERSRIWQERVLADPAAAGPSLTRELDALDLAQRALLWLDSGEGQGVVELAVILQTQPEEIRSRLQALDTALQPQSRVAAAEKLRDAAAEVPKDDLLERLDEARRVASKRDRRRAAVAFVCFALFVGAMVFVLFDLLNWKDANETLPAQPLMGPSQSSAP